MEEIRELEDSCRTEGRGIRGGGIGENNSV